MSYRGVNWQLAKSFVPPSPRAVIPLLSWLPAYQRANLVPDAVAALTVWALLVPEAMAYASLAGVPLQAGLYTAILPLLLYPVFGTSRHLVVGPSSTVAILSAVTVAPLATETEDFITLTSALAVLVGVILILAGVARMGWVADFMAKPVLEGFVIGLSLVVIVGQADKLFGIEAHGDNFWLEGWDIIRHLPDSHGRTVLVGAGALAILFGAPLIDRRAPGALIAVVVGIALSSWLDFEGSGVAIVGDIPAGLPPFDWPSVSLSEIQDLLPGAFGIVLVAYAESVAVGKSYAEKYRYELDANQELIALGFANAGAGLTQGFVVEGSLSKSAAAEGGGQRTQMASLINCALVVVTALALTGLFKNLPEAVLGAIVIHAVWHLVSYGTLRKIGDVSRPELAVATVCVVGVLTFDILPGLILAVGLSLLLVIYRASHPRIPVLGRSVADGTFEGTDHHPDVETTPGLLVLRIDSDLFFANANHLWSRVRELREADPSVEVLVIDAEGMSHLDITGAETLKRIESDLAADGVDLWLARVHAPVRETMRRAELEEAVGQEHFYPSIAVAVAAFAGRAE